MDKQELHVLDIPLFVHALDASSELICILNEEGRVIFANRAFLGTLGYTMDELAAEPTPLRMIIAQSDGVSRMEYSFHLGWRGEIAARKKDGSEFRIYLSAVPVSGADGTTRGLVLTARPTTAHDEALNQIRSLATDLERRVLVKTAAVVTQKDDLSRINEQLKTLVEELEAARHKADEANKVKSQFLTHVSHEMRTPLNSVIGFANLLAKNKEAHLSEQDIFYLNRITGNATHLLNVIGQMLDLSLIESGKLGLTISEINLAELIRETQSELKGHERADSVRMIADIPKGTQPIETDRQKLKQVLINLIANALKFTERGAVTVRVAVDALRRPVGIEVSDTGAGIPQEKLATIFEAFERVQVAGAPLPEGTGLGLTISRSLCTLMGYTISAESELGKGSSFTIHLVEGQPTLQA